MARPKRYEEGEVLDRAMEVFWTMGYDGASMAVLTKAMAMNTPSIYFAFGSKRGLFGAVLERYDKRRESHKNAILAAGTAREAVERLLFGAIDWLTDPDEPAGCLLFQSGLSAGTGNADVPIALSCRRNRVTSLLTERFQLGQQQGDLVATAEASELARYFQMVFNGLCVNAGSGVSREELKACAARALLGWPTA